MNNRLLVFAMLLGAVFAGVTARASDQGKQTRIVDKNNSLRHLVPDRWWEKAAAIKTVTLKPNRRFAHEISVDPVVVSAQLDEIKAQGFQAIEIFAPAEGLYAYSGLDTKTHYRIDPELGTMDDFRRLVRIVHSKNMAVTAFINIGYFSAEAPDWIEACKAKKAGIESEKVKWFLWADKADTPPPPTQEDIYVTREKRDRTKTWGWQYSELAGSYFWARWKAQDKDGNDIPLPQNNWGTKEWREEAARIVRFWMDTGIDGMRIDAPLCYPFQTWEDNRKCIVEVISSYGNTLAQPEGGRDPAWMTEAGYNCIMDYGLSYRKNSFQTQKEDAITTAMETGNPRVIEENLQDYHDVMALAGGVLWRSVSRDLEGNLAKEHLHRAVLAAIGDILCYPRGGGNPDAEATWILQTKYVHPALHPVATRRKLATNNDDKYYAILKTAKDGSERIVAVFNFQSSPQTVRVDLSVVSTSGVVDLRSRELKKREDVFKPVAIELPAYGYGFYEVMPFKNGTLFPPGP